MKRVVSMALAAALLGAFSGTVSAQSTPTKEAAPAPVAPTLARAATPPKPDAQKAVPVDLTKVPSEVKEVVERELPGYAISGAEMVGRNYQLHASKDSDQMKLIVTPEGKMIMKEKDAKTVPGKPVPNSPNAGSDK